MNEVSVREDFLYQLKELETLQSVCAKLLQTRHYAKMGEEGIHAIISKAKTLGIHPFQALNGGFYCIHGKVGMSTEMMNALIRKNGHSVTKDPKSNDEQVILHGKRADTGDTWTCTFSKKDAITAQLWNTATWKKYPEIMLYNRCMSMLFRQLFPDLSLGAGYGENELQEITKTGDYSNLAIADCEVRENHIPDAKKMVSNAPKEHIVGSNIMVDNTPKAIEDHSEDPIEMVPKLMTTTKEWEELENLMNQCTPTFQTKLCDRLLDMGVDDNSKLDMETFMKSRKACIENIELQKAKSNASSASQTKV